MDLDSQDVLGDSRYVVKPIYKAVRVLRTVCESPVALSLKDIAELSEIPKSTVYRYLYTMQKLDMITHDPQAETYSPGLGLWWLMQTADPFANLRQIGRRERRKLMNRFNETVNLGVLTGSQVLYLEIIESSRSLRMQAQPGTRDDVHSTALGKALLGFRPRSQWKTLIPEKMVRRTEHTIVARDVFLANLEQVRRDGYAIEHGENEDGATCIAAPILDEQGASIASISVSLPTSRTSEELTAEIVAAVIETSQMIRSQLSTKY